MDSLKNRDLLGIAELTQKEIQGLLELAGQLKKGETPKPEHPETDFSPEENEVQANHLEAFNSSLRR